MKVLIISQYFWPETFRINDLALGLRDLGHEVSVLTGLPNYPSGRLSAGYRFLSSRDDFLGIPVARVPLFPRGKATGWRLALNYLSFALSASLLGPWRCRQSVDAIFVFEPSPITVGWPAMVMQRCKQAPILFWVQDLWPESLSATGSVKAGWALKIIDRVVRHIYRHCDRILIQSPGFREPIERQGVVPEKILDFPNWAEGFYRPLDPSEVETESAELPQGFRLLFAGNIGASQSFPTILDAAELCRDQPELKWVILGDGRERAWVEQQIHARGLSDCVHLLGHRPMEAMPRYFAAADALLITLKRDPAFARVIPSKLQSYLACGKAVLGALDGEGAQVIRQAGAGLVVPSEDAQGLAAGARQLLNSSQVDRVRWGCSGHDYYKQHFERDRLLQRLEQILREAVGGADQNETTETLRCAA